LLNFWMIYQVNFQNIHLHCFTKCFSDKYENCFSFPCVLALALFESCLYWAGLMVFNFYSFCYLLEFWNSGVTKANIWRLVLLACMSFWEKSGEADVTVLGKKVKPVLSVVVVTAQFAEVERKLVAQCYRAVVVCKRNWSTLHISIIPIA
jgi:hypothetical protein